MAGYKNFILPLLLLAGCVSGAMTPYQAYKAGKPFPMFYKAGVRLQLTLTEEFETAAREHRELLELCRKRDTKTAVPFLRNHVLTAGTGLVAAIRSRRPAQVT